jgi:quinol monooxygenase YgiN
MDRIGAIGMDRRTKLERQAAASASSTASKARSRGAVRRRTARYRLRALVAELRGDAVIVVIGRVRTAPDKREELIRVGQTVAAASREEAGCLGYRLYEDTEAENDFVFVEEWDSDEALQQHFATSHIREFMQAVTATLISPPDVKFHTVARSIDLADVAAG